MPGIPIFSRSAREQIAKTVQDAKARKSRQPDSVSQARGGSGLLVQVTGPPVLIATTTTGTTTSTSSTATTSTTTPCIGNNPIIVPTLPETQAKYVYPGRIVYRNIDSLDNQEYFYPGEDVWIEELNQRPLGLNCKYPGHISSQYRGQLVVAVRNDLPPTQAALSCTGDTTTTTNCACQDYCEWTLTENNWVLINNYCNTAGGCNCPQPNFCPPDGGCADTITYCSEGGDPNTVLIDCTGTTSTSGTGTTTTEPPCGECVWKYGVGESPTASGLLGGNLNGWTLLSHTCTQECSTCSDPCSYFLSQMIEGHPIPPWFPDWIYYDPYPVLRCNPPQCEEENTPCTRKPTTTPPPCYGYCGWVWPDEPGFWWNFVTSFGTCRREGDAGPLLDCICYPPSIPGTVCGEYQETCCSANCIGTGDCSGKCTYRCDEKADPPEWVIIGDCGSSCNCTEPLFDCVDPCDIIQSACIPTTTTSATTSTTSSTTTTSCPTNCEWTCTQDSFFYYWDLTTPCGGDCECQPVDPLSICGPDASESDDNFGAGAVIISPCYPTTTSTSTTSTTTTTTTDPCEQNPCGGFVPSCMSYCFESQILGFFTWIPCPNQPICPTPCQYACGPCNAGTICTVCVGVCNEPTATTGTTQTGTGTTASFTTAWERPTTTTEPAVMPGDFSPLLWFHQDYVYEDVEGTDTALAQDELVELAIYPGDDPTSPALNYAQQSVINDPPLQPSVEYTVPNSRGMKWIGGGDAVSMDIDTPINVDLSTTDLTVMVVLRRPATDTAIVPIGSDAEIHSGVWIAADNTVRLADGSAIKSVGYTGNTGAILAVWTVESSKIYFQASGMAKTSVTEDSISGTITWNTLFALLGPPVMTHANNWIREIVVYDELLSSTDFDNLCAVGGYFDNTSGVHL